MDQPAPRFGWSILLGVLALAGLLTLALVMVELKKTPSLNLTPIGPVAAFTLTNQSGQTVTLSNLRGKVWVADIIFTRCPGPCLRMSKQMRELQGALPTASEAKLVSLTTDADFDTPAVLQTYAKRFNADPNRWMFLTGDTRVVANLAIDSLKLAAMEKTPEQRTSPEDLFVHSTMFVIVDKKGILRGVFETGGEDVDWGQSKGKIMAAVKQLEREP